jgi:hypothetical protein
MTQHHSIDHLSTATSRMAQSEAAMMQSDLKKLRDSIANTSRSIKEPVIKASHKKTKKTTSSLSLFGLNVDSLASFSAESFLEEAGLSGGYGSAAQNAGRNLAMLALGQRIR